MEAMLRAALVGTLGGLFLAACSPFGGASVFHCDQDSQCSAGGACKLPEGLCTVPNGACATGQEYGPNSGSMSGKCVGDEIMPDAPIDAPSSCTPNAKSCFNHAVETCKSTGDGFDPALREPCALTCTTGGTPTCVSATNIAANDQTMCNANNMAPALMPTTGTVTINATDIACSAGCGGGLNTIPRTSATPNNFYCLASINIPSGVNVSYAGVTGGVTLFSSGPVVIAGTISFNGGNATGTADQDEANDTPGAGGPGGFTGGAAVTNDSPGNPGAGPGGTMCGGRGGSPAEAAAAGAGGGGGGGGNQGTGGTAGDSRSQNLVAGQGGNGGTNTGCSTADGRPTLVGGAGGGGGADGAGGAGVQCGWPGGGGGGALQIVSRSMISGAGAITANGGTGYGDAAVAGGGGGGGAGGMILLEAPMVTFSGMLQVNGGNGGATDATAGTGAATTAVNGGNGTDAATALQGGPGGGGGGGRIRINGNGATCPGTASPTASCTSGALRATP